MKELIGTAILLAGLYGGTQVIKEIHGTVKILALEKAARRLTPLPRFKKFYK